MSVEGLNIPHIHFRTEHWDPITNVELCALIFSKPIDCWKLKLCIIYNYNALYYILAQYQKQCGSLKRRTVSFVKT